MHAVILSGDGEATKKRARELAAGLLCESGGKTPCGVCRHCRKILQGEFPGIHPDVIAVERQTASTGKLRREITVDQIRALGVDALVLPNEAAGKVYVFPEADAMNLNAQNAFLKLLEEPPAFVTFLLCAGNRDRLLPTVRSRCAELRVGGEAAADPESEKRAEGFLAARGDRAELLRWAVTMEKLDNARLTETVDQICAQAVRAVPDPGEILFLEKFLERAGRYLRANVGVKHVAGYLSTYVYEK